MTAENKHCDTFVYFSVVYFIFGIQFKTQDVVILFENYCEKSLTSDREEILTIVNNLISLGFF